MIEEEFPKKSTLDTLGDVLNERRRQDVKWGDQSHRSNGTWDAYRINANNARRDCDAAERIYGAATWADILQEEVYEALAESNEEKLRNELIQVAAVCVAWVEVLDKKIAQRGALS